MFHNSFFDDGFQPIVLSGMDCVGFEKNYTQCRNQLYSEFTCSRDHTAGVLCGAGEFLIKNKIISFLFRLCEWSGKIDGRNQ